MQFLDAIGLAYFWEKIKDWANSLFFSKKGGEITPESGLQYTINGEQLDVSKSGTENETIHIFNVDENRMEAISIVKTGGTATQVLMADGSVKEVGGKSGIAGLDTNGNVPLANLGNLDTTVAEVVTALPTSNIKRHIYLVKDSDTANNKYAEYVYTGDISAAYDSTKWEKLGDFRATVDLADYAKKKEAMHSMDVYHNATDIQISLKGVNDFPLGFIAINAVTSQSAGVMIPSDKTKLDGIEINANDYSLPLAAANTRGGIKVGYQANSGFPVKLDSEERAYVTIPIATQDKNGLFSYTDQKKLDRLDLSNLSDDAIVYMDSILKNVRIDKDTSSVSLTLVAVSDDETEVTIQAATSSLSGVMSASDKAKLDGIASGATADSAITTAEIDALFA